MTSFLIMSQVLVFSHAVLGELAAMSLLWGIKELVFLKEERLKWLKASYWIAFGSSILAWVVGGTYYLFYYPKVKPIIKDGPESWGHLVITETKEHVFLLVPVLLFLLAIFVHKRHPELLKNKALKKKLIILSVFTTLLILSMAAMGFLITWSARAALWVNIGA